MEKNLKSVEVNINVMSDTANVSKMLLVFDPERPTEIFNGIAQATKDLEKALTQAGILTKAGVGTGEFAEYMEYMKEVVKDSEEGIGRLQVVLDEVMSSDLQFKFVMADMIQEKIDEAQYTVDNYHSMFEEINIVPLTKDNVDDFVVKDSDEATE